VKAAELISASRLPPHEAVRLLAVATGLEPMQARGARAFDRAQLERFSELVERRRAGEPLQYLEGEVQFGPIRLQVDSRVLIPRPETEYLYSIGLDRALGPGVIVDLCTGSGALALALKRSLPTARVLAVDDSEPALEVASANGARLGLEVEWLLGDLWAALPGSLRGGVDLLVANPPYVAAGEWDGLPEDVRHEPYRALVAGPSGTEVTERILKDLRDWLGPGGMGLVEVGASQAESLAARYRTGVIADQYGLARFLEVEA
jgi:release factor glutamine methyltransferase